MEPLSREEMAAWRGHPATRKIIQYLRDKQAELAKQWADGAEMPPEAQIYAQMYGDLADLKYDDIAEFYGYASEEEEGDEQSETT